jgi:hypothetical protein
MNWYEGWKFSLKTDEECYVEDSAEKTLYNLFMRDYYKRVSEEFEKEILKILKKY